MTLHLSYYHHGKHAQKPKSLSINALPKILSVALGNTRHTRRPCPSVLRSVYLIIQPGLGILDSSSRPTLLLAALGHTSYSLVVHQLAKPRADSPISYAFRLIWLFVWVFRVRIYHYPSYVLAKSTYNIRSMQCP